MDIAYLVVTGLLVCVSMFGSYQRGRLSRPVEGISIEAFKAVEAQRDGLLATLERTTAQLEATTAALQRANERDAGRDGGREGR